MVATFIWCKLLLSSTFLGILKDLLHKKKKRLEKTMGLTQLNQSNSRSLNDACLIGIASFCTHKKSQKITILISGWVLKENRLMRVNVYK